MTRIARLRLPALAALPLAALPACAQTLPPLRPPLAGTLGPPPIAALAVPGPADAPASALASPGLPAPVPPVLELTAPQVEAAAGALRRSLWRSVPGALAWSPAREAAWIGQVRAAFAASDSTIDAPQVLVAVDRNPAVEQIAVMLAQPRGPWRVLGGGRVSTGQGGRRDYYLTPIGVFAHTDAILDFRAEGTVNENGVRGLGTQGMRVWDFGWHYAIKGWRSDGEGGDIRLQMHATDPALLEPRLGHPASEGCVRVSSAMNRFLDRFGVLDADYERAAADDIRYRALLLADRTPTPLAGRLLVVFDSRQPAGALPTAAFRPADLPPPEG
jgi:hypothetical protein